MSLHDMDAAVSRSIRRHTSIGLLTCTLLVGGAGAWAVATNLSGAVVASGHFVVDSYLKKASSASRSCCSCWRRAGAPRAGSCCSSWRRSSRMHSSGDLERERRER